MNCFRLAASVTLVAASTCLLASPALRPPVGNVLIVDASGSGQYTTIQAAVDAAIDGDVLLVRTGTYAGFLITNKALTVVEAAGANVQVQGSIRLRDLAADKTAVLSGLNAAGASSYVEELSVGLFLADNLGHVRVQDCAFSGGYGTIGSAASVRSSGDVALVACTLIGGLESPPPGSTYPDFVGSRGIGASAGSMLTVYGSSIRGQDGISMTMCSSYPGTDAGDGAQVSGSTLFSSNSSFRGGHGGDVEQAAFPCPYGGTGGDGIQASAATVRLLDSVTLGGEGGQVLPGCGFCGDVGYAGYDRNGGTFSDLTGTARSLVAPNPVQGGVTELVTLRGQPGDRVDIFVSDTTSSAQYVALWQGVLLVPLRAPPAATRLLIAGTIPAGGVLHFPIDIPAISPGAGSRTLYLQALYTEPQVQRYLSGARCMTILP